MAKRKRVSVLAGRIAAGKADPISAEEREIVAGLRTFYTKKYGAAKDPESPAQGGKGLGMMSSGSRNAAKPSNV